MTRGRKFLLIVATVTVAALGSVPILRPLVIRAVAAKVRRQVIALAANGLGAPLDVGSIEVSLVPTVLVLRDLRLEKDGVFGIRAGSSLDMLTLSGDPRALLRWGSRPVRIDTERAQKLNKARAERVGRPVEEIDKEMAAEVPLGRYGTAEEAADVIVFLGSDRASYVTGTTIQIDGGLVRGIQ